MGSETTVLSILCGLLRPDRGEAYVAGIDILNGIGSDWRAAHMSSDRCPDLQNAYGSMGVCPQFDVLWDLMTGEEHLRLYGMIKARANLLFGILRRSA